MRSIFPIKLGDREVNATPFTLEEQEVFLAAANQVKANRRGDEYREEDIALLVRVTCDVVFRAMSRAGAAVPLIEILKLEPDDQRLAFDQILQETVDPSLRWPVN
jgi:hypothetical protein